MLLCGDGEYSISTTRVLRSKCYGSAIEAVWSDEGNGDYAIKETTTHIKMFKNFKEVMTISTPFPVEKLFGGKMLGARGSNFLVLYSWESGDVVKKIDTSPTSMYWSEDGSFVTIATDDGFYVLSVTEGENGFDFSLLQEIGDAVISGCWYSHCFIYNTEKGVKYYVAGEVIIVSHVHDRLLMLGYLEKENMIVLVDKNKNVTGIALDKHLLLYQTAVLAKNFELANSILPNVGERELEKLSLFLQGQGYLKEAMKVTRDEMRKLDLAISLKDIQLSTELLNQLDDDHESSKYWSQLSEICLQKGDMTSALKCIERAHDYNTMLLLASSYSNEELIQRVAELAEKDNKENVAFMAYFLKKDVTSCVDVLIRDHRYPEAAFFASKFCPEKAELAIEAWREEVSKMDGERKA